MNDPSYALLAKAWIDLYDPHVRLQIAALLSCFALACAAGQALRAAYVEAEGIWQF